MRKIIFSVATIVALGLVGCGGGASSGGGTSAPSNAIPAGGGVNAPANTQNP